MKKRLYILFISLGILLIGFSLPYIAISPARADNTCKWEQDYCGLFHGWREVCVTSGDGNVCNCGDVTRPCHKQQ